MRVVPTVVVGIAQVRVVQVLLVTSSVRGLEVLLKYHQSARLISADARAACPCLASPETSA